MKATGIIRRIDDLGRIVIPKEIRKNLRLKNGENLEIFINENENIVLRKYSQMDKFKEFAENLTESVNSITKNNILITNTDIFIAASSKLKKYINNEISNEIITMIENRQIINNGKNIKLTKDKTEEANFIFCPIITEGDAIGSIIILTENEIKEEDTTLLKIIATFLANYIED